MHRSRQSESGNIVIYVMGAIFLMGLLIVMVRGSNAPGSNIDAEALSIKVSEVRQYSAELERAVAFIMQNGYSETDIRFAHPKAHADYSAAGDINNDPGRQVFNKMGGGATWREPPSGIQTVVTPWVFNGRNTLQRIGTTAATNAAVDLIAFLPYVTKDFCIAVNKSAGVTNPTGSPPPETSGNDIVTRFAGTFSFSTWLADDTTQALYGRKEGCYEGGGTPATGTYHYYRVLLAR